jgi:hypothetical protein
LLLGLLHDPDFEFVRQVCETIRRHVKDLPAKEAATLHGQVVEFMSADDVQGRERVLTSCLLLLGFIGRPEARKLLMGHAAPNHSPYVRRHALLALKNLLPTGAAATAMFKELSAYLDDEDGNLVRIVAEILGKIAPSTLSVTQRRGMLANKHYEVRALAVHLLAGCDTVAANRELLELLNHPDPGVQEPAARALAGHKKAAAPCLEVLLSETEAEPAWRLAKILKPHAEALTKAQVTSCASQATAALLEGHALAEPLLYVLRHADPTSAQSVLQEAGLKHRKAGRWPQAVDCLRRLVNTEAFTDDVRYELSLCDLKVSPKVLTPGARADDHALRGFSGLLRNKAFKLAARLKKEKTLDASDLYFVGFSFLESVPEHGEFGREIIEHVAKTWPKTEEGKNARKLLKSLPARQ